MVNKAHVATVRRICERYGGVVDHGEEVDVIAGELRIEIETWATLADGIERLSQLDGLRYLAVTNKDAILDALRLTQNTGIGVMDSFGRILQPATGHSELG